MWEETGNEWEAGQQSIRRGLEDVSPLYVIFPPPQDWDSTPHWGKFNRCHRSRAREFRFGWPSPKPQKLHISSAVVFFGRNVFFFSSTRVVGYRAWTCQVDGFIHDISRRRSIALHRLRLLQPTSFYLSSWFFIKAFCGLSNHFSFKKKRQSI